MIYGNGCSEVVYFATEALDETSTRADHQTPARQSLTAPSWTTEYGWIKYDQTKSLEQAILTSTAKKAQRITRRIIKCGGPTTSCSYHACSSSLANMKYILFWVSVIQ